MKYLIKILVYLIIVIITFFLMHLEVKGMELSDIMFWKEKVVIAQEIIKYKEGDKIPESVIDELIVKYATGTKAYQIKRTLYCESGYNNVQSYITKNGKREQSFGISQIHLPSHNITKEQALDPEYAIKFMSDRWEDTKWYGYLRLEDKCNII